MSHYNTIKGNMKSLSSTSTSPVVFIVLLSLSLGLNRAFAFAFHIQNNPKICSKSLNYHLIPKNSRKKLHKLGLQADAESNVKDDIINTADEEQTRLKRKAALKSLLGIRTKSSTTQNEAKVDSVLACPVDKTPLKVKIAPQLSSSSSSFTSSSALIASFDVNDSNKSSMMGRSKKNGKKVLLETESGTTYKGSTNGYFDLLIQQQSDNDFSGESEDGGGNDSSPVDTVIDAVRVFVPPPLRSYLPNGGDGNKEYIPMRDLFTSPAVSFAYERGWRQGFATAGFPGADTEYEMVRDFFAPAIVTATDSSSGSTVVDMSCATGLFTRRLAKSGDYDRVIGCDYSESMLNEARSRINRMNKSSKTKLDLVRLDVAQIPMQDSSVDALHAGAAMHCWPDVQAGLNEIYRVLKPGGRYFASTFLSSYFRTLQATETDVARQMQAFQYFESTDVLKEMVVKAGFREENITVDLLGNACIIIKAEK